MAVLALSAGAWAQEPEAVDGGAAPAVSTAPVAPAPSVPKPEPVPEPLWALSAGVGLFSASSYLASSMSSLYGGAGALAGLSGGYFVSAPSVPVSLVLERRLTGATWLVVRGSASTSSSKSAPTSAPASQYYPSTTADATTSWDGSLSLGARHVLNVGALVELSLYAELAAARSSFVAHTTTTTPTSQTPPVSTTTSGISTTEATTYGGVAGLIAEHGLTKALAVRLDLRVFSASVSTISNSSATDDGSKGSSGSRSSRAGLDLSPALQLRLQW